jgi:DNA (cytosine-5)-methyltransferase 1
MIKVGSDFSGVGAFNQALIRLGIEYKEVFACDMDKYARQTFIENYGEPEYYPTNVYEREIPKESLDVYMTSPPCQAFSMAGKRLGKEDKRGILFFNSYEFIQENKPRFFIFENVKGLLSEDNGKTFQEWVNMLGGKSVNGLPVLFPYEESVPYHLYYKVLNAKEHGVPQNRERVFLIGIRDDKDNTFRFPIEEHLTKRLKDVLEDNVEEKYFLSEKMINGFLKHNDNHNEKGTGVIFKPKNNDDIDNCLRANAALCATDNSIKVGYINQDTQASALYSDVGDYRTDEGFRWRQDGNSPCLMASMRDKWSEKFTAQNPPITTNSYKIRRLTPRECFRLMDFPDTFTWSCSDSQAYKQAGNSIVVNVLYKILKNLPL